MLVQLACNGSAHLRGRLWFAFRTKTAGNLVKTSFGESSDGTQENPIGSFLHGEFRSRFPGV